MVGGDYGKGSDGSGGKGKGGIMDLVLRHEGYRSRCINLVASENVASHVVRMLMASDLMHRYSLEGFDGDGNFYRGTRYIEQIVRYADTLAKELFNAKYADTRAISGHVCSLAVLMRLCTSDESIMVLSRDAGGYPGYMDGYMPSRLMLKTHSIPYDHANMCIDVDACIARIQELRPRLVIVAPSVITFHTPLRDIAGTCMDTGSMLVYDASHVLGLIAGRAFPNPLDEGASILMGSTHKSLPGPQGGMILADRDDGYGLGDYMPLRVIDNPHFNRIAALALALEEVREHGMDYARQVVSNAKALARALADNGVEVRRRASDGQHTETHQVLLEHKHRRRFARMLEDANIIVDGMLRLGTCEVTRRGMKEGEMRHIAEMISRVYHVSMDERAYHESQITNKIRSEAEELASRFNGIHYSSSIFSLV
ncbi:MAG: hypothetical protein NZ517_05265 [Candidatus Nitrosocaldus sp.]|nr:hypothetical protein [Candidatus Nitrosocaldus sp.]